MLYILFLEPENEAIVDAYLICLISIYIKGQEYIYFSFW